MTRIIVKNGDWDTARTELGSVLDAKKKAFNAQFEAAFAPARKPAAAEPARAAVSAQPAATTVAGKLILARAPRR